MYIDDTKRQGDLSLRERKWSSKALWTTKQVCGLPRWSTWHKRDKSDWKTLRHHNPGSYYTTLDNTQTTQNLLYSVLHDTLTTPWWFPFKVIWVTESSFPDNRWSERFPFKFWKFNIIIPWGHLKVTKVVCVYRQLIIILHHYFHTEYWQGKWEWVKDLTRFAGRGNFKKKPPNLTTTGVGGWVDDVRPSKLASYSNTASTQRTTSKDAYSW